MFRSNKTTTNTVQKNLMLFVTPTLINPDGTRYHFPEERRKGQSSESSNPFNRTNLVVHVSKGRQKIMSKLNRIRVENVAYNNLPLSEVIKDLTILAKARDPEKVGINFFISRGNIIGAGVQLLDAIACHGFACCSLANRYPEWRCQFCHH